MGFNSAFKGLNTELNPICHFLALLGAHPILHISRIRVKLCRHRDLILEPGKLTDRGGPNLRPPSHPRTAGGCECWNDKHSDCTRSNAGFRHHLTAVGTSFSFQGHSSVFLQLAHVAHSCLQKKKKKFWERRLISMYFLDTVYFIIS